MKELSKIIEQIKPNEKIIIDNIDSNGIDIYEQLVKWLKSENVAKNSVFQELYHSFYLDSRFVDDKFESEYFKIMEELKNSSDIDIIEILRRLHNCKTTSGDNKVQLSYGTKLANLINNNFPLYDRHIRNTLGLPDFSRGTFEDKLILCNNIINSLTITYKQILDDKLLESTLNLFDTNFPNNKLSSVKKLDFIFWTFSKLAL